MTNKELKAYIMFISSMLIFGTIGIFRRYIPLSSGMLSFIRGILGSAFLVIIILAKKSGKSEKIGKKNVILLAVTGAIMAFNWIFLFEAYNYTTVATATMCYYMQPTIVILLSPLILKEKLTIKKILCAAVAIIGMVSVSGVAQGKSINYKDAGGIACGLAAAALYATVIILNKKINVSDAYKKTAIQLISAAIAVLPYVIITEDFTSLKLNTSAILMILAVGIVHTGLAYALYFGSMKYLRAQSIAVLSYIDPVFALILSSLVLSEKMSAFGILGAVLIIGSALISEISLKKAVKIPQKS